MGPAFHWVTALHMLIFLQMTHLIAVSSDYHSNMTRTVSSDYLSNMIPTAPVPNPTDANYDILGWISIPILIIVVFISIAVIILLLLQLKVQLKCSFLGKKCCRESCDPESALQKEEEEELQMGTEQLQRENAQLKEEKEGLQEKVGKMQKELDWRRARNNSDDITLDADTAHPNLFIEEDKKSLTHEAQPQKSLPNPERFDATVCVLGSQGFSSGKHYWEVDVESSIEWDLGVARKSTGRKGKLSLSPTEGFWVLGLSGRDYWAKTDPWTRIIVQKKPKKIGVYFSYQERQVTFFSVTDMSVLFTFKDCSFSGEVCPFFKNSHKETTIRICSIKEE